MIRRVAEIVAAAVLVVAVLAAAMFALMLVPWPGTDHARPHDCVRAGGVAQTIDGSDGHPRWAACRNGLVVVLP